MAAGIALMLTVHAGTAREAATVTFGSPGSGLNMLDSALALPHELPVGVVGVPVVKPDCPMTHLRWRLAPDEATRGAPARVFTQVVWSNWCRPWVGRRPFHLAGINSPQRELKLPPLDDTVESFANDRVAHEGSRAVNFLDRDVCLLVWAANASQTLRFEVTLGYDVEPKCAQAPATLTAGAKADPVGWIDAENAVGAGPVLVPKAGLSIRPPKDSELEEACPVVGWSHEVANDPRRDDDAVATLRLDGQEPGASPVPAAARYDTDGKIVLGLAARNPVVVQGAANALQPDLRISETGWLLESTSSGLVSVQARVHVDRRCAFWARYDHEVVATGDANDVVVSTSPAAGRKNDAASFSRVVKPDAVAIAASA